MTPAKFRALVWRFYRAHGRHDLPWRKTQNPYRILVSEVMLQQTQVERVIPFYKSFLKRFPTAKALAEAPLSDVLVAWQGLGYNRRAKMLHEAAGVLAVRKARTIAELEELPGVGTYTARAVAAFAFDIDTPVIETNIRTAIIHHFFGDATGIADADIEAVLVRVLPKGRSREWYSALMDYGASLKRSGISHNARSTTHAKQPRFAGSMREARGAILRQLALGGVSAPGGLTGLFGNGRRAQMREALRALWQEKLIEKRGTGYALTGASARQ
jgi:A/G-specific adenine glycosylase